MASITGNGSKGHHKFILTVTQSTQSTENNTSTVSYKFQIAPVQTTWNWEQWADAISYSFTINGTKYTGTIPNYDGYSTVTLKSGTQTVTHNSDGTKSISYSFSVTDTSGQSYTSGNASANGTLTLTTIARATTPTLSATSVVANGSNSVTINIAPASSSFKHKVRYDFGSLTGQSSGVGIGSGFSAQGNVSVTFVPPASLCSQIPNAKSGTIKINLYTYTSSGTHIGTKSINLTLTVPSYMPSIGVPEINGQNLLSGAYVAGKSSASIFFDVATSYGATVQLKDIKGTIDGKTYSGNAFNTSVFSSGSKSLSIKVTDSRGYTSTYLTPTTDMINVYAYSNPTITEFTLTRQEDDTTVIATVKGTVSAINNKNAKTITVTLNGVTKPITSSAYTINGTATFTGVNSDVTYTGTAKIQDSYTSVSKNAVVPTVAVTMDFYKDGNGIAMGKVAEYGDLFDVNWLTRMRKAFTADALVTFKNHLYHHGHIYMGGNKGATGENHIKFSNPDNSTNPHNVYIYGGNPNDTTAIGIYDAGKSRRVMNYTDSDNKIFFGYNDTKFYFNNIILSDFVVEQGISGVWSWKKWNSGTMEVTGTASQTPTALNNGNNSITVTMPVSFVDTSFRVLITPAKCGLMVSAFGDCNTSNDITHTKNSFVLSYKYNHGVAYTTNFNVIIQGKWK